MSLSNPLPSVLACANLRTASLCFDNVGLVYFQPYGDLLDNPDAGWGMLLRSDYSWNDFKKSYESLHRQIEVLQDQGGSSTEHDWVVALGDAENQINRSILGTVPDPALLACTAWLERQSRRGVRILEEHLGWTTHGIRNLYCLPNAFEADQIYSAGTHEVAILALSELDIVDDERLEWRQVFEFRHDKASREKYQRFTRWLDENMAGKSHRDIFETIEQLYDDYLFALKKHGFESRKGYFETLLNPTILGASGTTIAALIAGASSMGAPVIATGTVVTIGIAGAKILLTKRENKFSLEELEREHAEIAFLHATATTHRL